MIEIEEEETINGSIRFGLSRKHIVPPGEEAASEAFVHQPRFGLPGPYYERPVSKEGRVSFHFSVRTVSKRADGSSLLRDGRRLKALSASAAPDQDKYVTRKEAVMTLSPAQYQLYMERQQAMERVPGLGGETAIFSNIDDDPLKRQEFWRLIHECARTPSPDQITLHKAALSSVQWREVAMLPKVPEEVAEAALRIAEELEGGRVSFTDETVIFELDRLEARPLLGQLKKLAGWDRDNPAMETWQGRGGRTQYRLTAALPADLQAADRAAIVEEFCQYLADIGVMYTAAIHAPDYNNNDRNYHLHLCYYDGICDQIELEDGTFVWDFAYRENEPDQGNRQWAPYRGNKTESLSRDPEGGNHRQFAAGVLDTFRDQFAHMCNKRLRLVHGLSYKRLFDPRSYADMGIDQEPCEPMGSNAAALETVGVPTDVGLSNAEKIWSGAFRRRVEADAALAESKRQYLARARKAEAQLANDERLAETATKLKEAADEMEGLLDAIGDDQNDINLLLLTVKMAESRAQRTADTCDRLLEAIKKGKAKKAEADAADAIQERLRLADEHLDRIGDQYAPDLEAMEPRFAKLDELKERLKTVEAAIRELLAQDVPDTQVPAPEFAGEEAGTANIQDSAENQREKAKEPSASDIASHCDDESEFRGDPVLNDIFARILKNGMPIVRVDDVEATVLRVPGLSREEVGLLRSKKCYAYAQARLAGIRDQQSRLKDLVLLGLKKHGPEGLADPRTAEIDMAAPKMRHLFEIYKDHPEIGAWLAANEPSTKGSVASHRPTPDAEFPDVAAADRSAQSPLDDSVQVVRRSVNIDLDALLISSPQAPETENDMAEPERTETPPRQVTSPSTANVGPEKIASLRQEAAVGEVTPQMDPLAERRKILDALLEELGQENVLTGVEHLHVQFRKHGLNGVVVWKGENGLRLAYKDPSLALYWTDLANSPRALRWLEKVAVSVPFDHHLVPPDWQTTDINYREVSMPFPAGFWAQTIGGAPTPTSSIVVDDTARPRSGPTR